MRVRGWGYAKAHAAANDLEQELRATAEKFGGNRLHKDLFDIWYYHLARNFDGAEHDHLVEMAQQAARQLWKYL